MSRNTFLPLLSLVILSLACNRSAIATATQITQATSIPTSQPNLTETRPATVDSESDVSSDEFSPATRQQLTDVLSHARDVKLDITYCTVDGVDLKLDMYFPKGATNATPLAVFIHGGGWSIGNKRASAGVYDYPALLDSGFTIASLDYRLAPQYRFPTMIEDVKCAIRFLRTNANLYNIAPNRIGVWGLSAGSHLSMLLGVTDESAGFDVGQYPDQSSRVQAVVDMSGPADLTADFSTGFVKARNSAFVGYDLSKASPITYITADDPPFLIIQGDQDILVPIDSGQAQKLFDSLTAVSVPAQLVIVKSGPHMLNAPNQSPSRAELTDMIVQFFTEHLK